MTSPDNTPVEPTDLGARVFTGRIEWARRSSDGRWGCIGATQGTYSWWSLWHLFPTATLTTPATSTGRVIPARTGDPHTSHTATAAVRKVRAGSQRALLLAAFGSDMAVDLDGFTDEKAAMYADGVYLLSEYAKRCSELRQAGLIEPTGETRKGLSGLDRIVSRITPEGSRVLTSLNT